MVNDSESGVLVPVGIERASPSAPKSRIQGGNFGEFFVKGRLARGPGDICATLPRK
jgi:hypothetical protein